MAEPSQPAASRWSARPKGLPTGPQIVIVPACRFANKGKEGALHGVRVDSRSAGRVVTLPPAAAADGLEAAALAWMEPYWNAAHLVRTRDWARELDPHANAALVIAALTHDIERHYPGGPRPGTGGAGGWDDPGYVREHCERSARIVGAWLADRCAPADLRKRVEELVRRHEEGGTPEADLLQAADSLSFLEVNDGVPLRWIADGRASVDQARAKLVWMRDRIRLPWARRLAEPVLARALERFDAAVR